MKYPEHLLKLIAVLKRLPGVGSRSAERFAFHLISWPEERLAEMSDTLGSVKEKLKHCSDCGALIGEEACSLCDRDRRQTDRLCVVASAKDIFLIEETGEYKGLYHVLGGLLSPLQGQTPDIHMLEKLKERVKEFGVGEVIIALDSTLEGDATALFLKKELETLEVETSRLALGLPMGSSLDYIDGGTLAQALAGRHSY